MSLLIMDNLHTVPLKKDTSYKKYASSEVASSFSSGSILCDKKEDLTQSTVCQNDDHDAKKFPDISKEQSGFCLGSENRNRKEERSFEVNMEDIPSPYRSDMEEAHCFNKGSFIESFSMHFVETTF